MTIDQARELAALLTTAANAAEAAGETEIGLVEALQAADDRARAELAAAIARAAQR
ncbi:MAG: hypothetical protein IT529_06195 [Burkholderiales bacterium]|nr:hypothetical protein [Burkholderiales bacterium]